MTRVLRAALTTSSVITASSTDLPTDDPRNKVESLVETILLLNLRVPDVCFATLPFGPRDLSSRQIALKNDRQLALKITDVHRVVIAMDNPVSHARQVVADVVDCHRFCLSGCQVVKIYLGPYFHQRLG
jgi:hypothetical protein